MTGVVDGERCYRLVEEYAALGAHRTGTEVDEATRSWFMEQLRSRGASTETIDYEFERYETQAAVEVDGESIECLPLWYEAVGRVTTGGPYTETLDLFADVAALGLGEALDRARASGRPAAVLATGSDGRLVAQNREPQLAGGILTALVPGGTLDGARSIELSIDATTVPGRSSTVVATVGGESARPVVVTTPLTGWFTCAGERGTGIAIALEVAALLSERHAVTVVATTGHELEYLGAREYLSSSDLRPGAVLHVGASVAAGDPGEDGVPRLSPLRVAFTNQDGASRDDLEQLLEPAGLAFAESDEWGGEGELWRRRGAPILSLVGTFRRFHTPDDVADRVTTPEALSSVGSSVAEAARYLAELSA